jgi:hypothetical protein
MGDVAGSKICPANRAGVSFHHTEGALGNIMSCVYIVKVEAIHGPLFVFKNYGSYGENVTKLFCTLQERKWGKYFSGKVDSSNKTY